jgi:WD40 repeat protein
MLTPGGCSDIPQIILTFLIEDYYEEGSELTNVALVSVIASLYDTLIKLAEAFDERGDVVETGVWCKESLWAHKKSVTGIVSIPIHEDEEEEDPELTIFGSSQSRVHIKSQSISDRSRLSMMEQAREAVSETKLPRLSFLSVSLDHSIRVWDTDASVPGHKRDKCITTIRGHTKGVTCLALLGDLRHHKRRTSSYQDHSNVFFLTGSRDGTAKMWNLEGKCIRTYAPIGEDKSTITSITYVNREKNFVCAHENGIVRLWEIPNGTCLVKYQGHNVAVNAICSLEDSCSFLSGSEDCTIRLWSTSSESMAFIEETDSSSESGESVPSIVLEKPLVKKVSLKTFKGHTGAVLSLACVEPGAAFLSGSHDKTAR